MNFIAGIVVVNFKIFAVFVLVLIVFVVADVVNDVVIGVFVVGVVAAVSCPVEYRLKRLQPISAAFSTLELPSICGTLYGRCGKIANFSPAQLDTVSY